MGTRTISWEFFGNLMNIKDIDRLLNGTRGM